MKNLPTTASHYCFRCLKDGPEPTNGDGVCKTCACRFVIIVRNETLETLGHRKMSMKQAMAQMMEDHPEVWYELAEMSPDNIMIHLEDQ